MKLNQKSDTYPGTPAIVASVGNHIRTIEEIVGLADQDVGWGIIAMIVMIDIRSPFSSISSGP